MNKGLVENNSFSLTKLLHDLLDPNFKIESWQDFEGLVVDCCFRQDPRCVRNKDTDPDVILTNGYGIEAKSVSNRFRDINLNSAPPNPKTYYVIGYIQRRRIKNIAIVSGANFYSPEIDKISQIDTTLQNLSNINLRYRTRVMYQIGSPFKIWGTGSFIVDKFGKVTRS